MFDPFTKSKSTRNNDTFRKSLLSDFAKTSKVVESLAHESSISSSPARLHGVLKLKTRHGSPFFEFTLDIPVDVLVARRRRAENGLNWVYTFHSKGLKNVSPMVGQVQVACYLRANTEGGGAFNDSVVMEFIVCDVKNHKDYDNSAKRSMEIAAIVVQIPYEKRESLKNKCGDETSLLNLCEIKERKCINNYLSFNVVLPSGDHGLPNADVTSFGPSSLLERWRSNGGCDCGGWDMGCPLTVFGNEDIQSVDDRLVWENWRPFELFVKGGKDNTPSLVITAIVKGCYNVDFHAKLSTLQAFSVCIAMLHCTETSTTTTDEREKSMLESNQRVFVDEEISDFIKAGTAKKRKESKKMGEKLPSFKMKPPFSPISRV